MERERERERATDCVPSESWLRSKIASSGWVSWRRKSWFDHAYWSWKFNWIKSDKSEMTRIVAFLITFASVSMLHQVPSLASSLRRCRRLNNFAFECHKHSSVDANWVTYFWGSFGSFFFFAPFFAAGLGFLAPFGESPPANGSGDGRLKAFCEKKHDEH